MVIPSNISAYGFVLMYMFTASWIVIGSDRVALVIGNTNYEERKLPNAQNDARDLAPMLEQFGFKTDLKINARSRKMKRAIESFGKNIPPDGVALFYFAGHGIQRDRTNYIAPIDCNLFSRSIDKDKAIALDDVIEIMSRSESALNIIILDACRERPRGRTRGFGPMKKGKNLFVAYATEPGSTADDGPGKNGLYTSVLLDVMEEMPGLMLRDFFTEVERRVIEASGKLQIPWVEGSLAHEFSFSGNKDPSGYGIGGLPRRWKSRTEYWLDKIGDYHDERGKDAQQIIFEGKDFILLVPKPLKDIKPDLYRRFEDVEQNIMQLEKRLDNASDIRSFRKDEEAIIEMRTAFNQELLQAKTYIKRIRKRNTHKRSQLLGSVLLLIDYAVKKNEEFNKSREEEMFEPDR